MTDPAIIAASYAAERNYSHNPDDVIDASDAVGAWGTAKESTTKLVDLSDNGNIADIHGAMPTEGFIQGRRFTVANSNYLDCGNDSSLNIADVIIIEVLINITSYDLYAGIISKTSFSSPNLKGYELRMSGSDVVQFRIGDFTNGGVDVYTSVNLNKLEHIIGVWDGSVMSIYKNGVLIQSLEYTRQIVDSGASLQIGKLAYADLSVGGQIIYSSVCNLAPPQTKIQQRYNTFARLPFWGVNYTDYPDKVTEYTDNLPYSSSIINSGTFKVDDDKLQCVSAGTITYNASYEFDGSEYIKVEIDGVEYAGTGTITQGNTTVSVAQGSNKVTIEAGTGDTIDSVDIQFREEV